MRPEELKNTIDSIPDSDYITVVHHNGQAESSMPAKDFRRVFGDRKDDWMRQPAEVNTLSQPPYLCVRTPDLPVDEARQDERVNTLV